jgi:protocatechuate 3,4-dioxygenase beta subunit
LDTDNDLIIVNDSLTAGVGQITHLSGRLTDVKGEPIRNAVVEIWQVDGNGVYLHQGSSAAEKRDKNFQGFGRFLTGSTGEYYFRTVKPVAYPGRTPHIHFAVKMKGREKWTTQCYIAGEPQNERDGIFTSATVEGRRALCAQFIPLPGSKIGELVARFDLVMGFTPASP